MKIFLSVIATIAVVSALFAIGRYLREKAGSDRGRAMHAVANAIHYFVYSVIALVVLLFLLVLIVQS